MDQTYSQNTHCSFSDKRRYTRIPCSAPIEYAKGTQTFRNLSRDISANGLFIETWDPFSIGDKLVVNIPLWDDRKTIKINGKIVRKNKSGIGVQFT